MGRSITPTYRIEYRENGNTASKRQQMAWNTQSNGRANLKNLERWRVTMNKSFQLGGANDHISISLGVVPHIAYARIVHQRTGFMVAETTMPMFEVV